MLHIAKAGFLAAALFHIAAFTPLLAQPVLTGAVQTTRNEPISGAQVELVPLPGNFEAGRLRLEGRDLPGPRSTVRTDARGRFSLPAPHPGIWKVVVRAAGWVPMQYGPLPALDAEELPPVELSQDVGARIQVTTQEGQPVAGAWIVAPATASAAGEGTSRGGGWRPELRVGRTAADGSLTLPRLDGERLQLSIFAPGRPEELLPDFTEGTVRLQPARATGLPLQVVTPAGAPVEGVLVRAGSQAWPVGLTAADGTLLVPVRDGEEVKLRLVALDGRQHAVSLGSHQNGGARTVTLPSAVQVTGKVLDATSGRGLADAVLWLDADPAIAVRTDREGRYTVVTPARGRLSLGVRAVGFLPGRLTLSDRELANGRAPAVALERAATLHGAVLGPGGQPLAGASVTVVHASVLGPRTFSPRDPVADRAATDAAGRFALHRLRPGEEYELRVSQPGFFPEARNAVIPSRGSSAAPVVVALRPACGVHGSIRDPQGQPVTSAKVFLRPAQRPGGERLTRPPDADRPDPTTSASESDPAGRFSIVESPAVEVDLEVRKAGYAPAQRRTLRIGPSCGASFDAGRIVLTPGVRLAGRVVSGRDQAVVDARIFLVDRVSSRLHRDAMVRDRKPDALTGRDGRFALDDLPRGVTYDLLVEADGYLGAEMRGVRPSGRGSVLIRLEPAGVLRGRVVDEASEAVSGAVVALNRPGGRPDNPGERPVGEPLRRSVQTDADGRFELETVPQGRVTLSVRAQGLVPLQDFEVTLPQPRSAPELTLVLRRGARLEGQVKTTGGEPVPAVRIALDNSSGLSDAEGRYAIEGLEPGRHEVEIVHPHYRRMSRPLKIEEGTNRFDVELDAGVEVAGHVVDPEGKPVAAAHVELATILSRSEGRQHREYRARTGEDGRFLLHPVAAGRYRLQASASGLAAAELAEPVVVSGQPVDDLEIVLREGATVSGRVLGLSAEELAVVAVTAQGAAGERPASVDAEGRYEVRDLPAGDWLLRASLWQGERQVEARVPIGPSDRRVVRDLEFGRPVTLSGRVFFDGEPLAGSTVSVRGERFGIERNVTSDFEGGFVIQDLERDRYWLGVRSPQRLIVHNETVDLVESREVEIRLEAATIAGRVEEEGSGEAIPAAILSLRPAEGTDFLIASSSQPDGTFRIVHVPPGSYRLSVAAGGFAPAEREISVVGGEELNGLELALTSTSGLQVQVRLASGQVPELLHVRALDGQGQPVLAGTYLSKPSGTEISSLPAGTWQLFVGASGGAVTSGTVTVPGKPVAMTLPPAARLHVRIPELTSENLLATLKLLGQDQAPFWTLGPGGSIVQSWTLSGGSATVDGVPAGLWSVVVEAADGRVWQGSAATSGTGETALTLP